MWAIWHMALLFMYSLPMCSQRTNLYCGLKLGNYTGIQVSVLGLSPFCCLFGLMAHIQVLHSLRSGSMFTPSSTKAPSSMLHSGIHTKVSLTSISRSSRAHNVRQNPSFNSMAHRYQVRRRKSGEPFRGSYPGLHRPAIFTVNIRTRMPSKIQTGRKMRNQFHWTFPSSLRTNMMRNTRVKTHVNNTLCANDISY